MQKEETHNRWDFKKKGSHAREEEIRVSNDVNVSKIMKILPQKTSLG